MKREQKKQIVTWVDSSDPSVQHFFSPFRQRGLLNKAERASKNWRVNLEDGWMKPEKNTKFQMLGKARFLTAEDGSPYIVRNGPVRGKFLAFDAWQSNEELSTIYQKAFEEVEGAGGETGEQKVWIDGRYRTLLQYWKGDGHIVSVSYNCAFNCMRVEFENKGAVVCYLGVPQGTVDMLKDCVGKVRAGKGKHNHMLGVKFWDYVRIRGTKHGSRYPFWYVTDENGHTYESAVSKLKSAEIDNYMKQLQMKNVARLNNMSIEKRGTEQYIIDLDTIFNSPKYNKMYNSGEDIPGVDIDDLDTMVDDYTELMSAPVSDASYNKKEKEFVSKHLQVINKLRNLFKDEIHEKDKVMLSELAGIQKEAAEQTKRIKKDAQEQLLAKNMKSYQEHLYGPLERDYIDKMSPEEYKQLSAKYSKQLLGEYGELKDIPDLPSNADLERDYKEVVKGVLRYDRKHPQTKQNVATGIGRGTNWNYNYNDKSFHQWKKENPESYEQWRKAQQRKKGKGSSNSDKGGKGK